MTTTLVRPQEANETSLFPLPDDLADDRSADDIAAHGIDHDDFEKNEHHGSVVVDYKPGDYPPEPEVTTAIEQSADAAVAEAQDTEADPRQQHLLPRLPSRRLPPLPSLRRPHLP